MFGICIWVYVFKVRSGFKFCCENYVWIMFDGWVFKYFCFINSYDVMVFFLLN